MKIRIIRVSASGPQFDNLVPGSVHDVIDPPKDKARKFPNTEDSVWVMGNTDEPVRIFTSGRLKEAIILIINNNIK